MTPRLEVCCCSFLLWLFHILVSHKNMFFWQNCIFARGACAQADGLFCQLLCDLRTRSSDELYIAPRSVCLSRRRLFLWLSHISVFVLPSCFDYLTFSGPDLASCSDYLTFWGPTKTWFFDQIVYLPEERVRKLTGYFANFCATCAHAPLTNNILLRGACV